jgi:hypothetical protein
MSDFNMKCKSRSYDNLCGKAKRYVSKLSSIRNKMIILLIILVLFSCKREIIEERNVNNEISHQVKNSVKLQISTRVDTTNSDIKEVLNLYENYINSQPDSIYDNPYWNSKEKAQFKDFDFSRIYIYNGISSSQLFRVYTPFVLSIEPKNEKYQIRVLYSNSATEAPYVGSRVWCIHKVNARLEKGTWRLENLLEDKTKDWTKMQMGFIEYIYPQEHQFNVKKANGALKFCNEIVRRFNPEFNETFRFYLANGVDELGELENFDYVFSGVTTGKAKEGMILSSKVDEFYPHEFIHKLLPVNENRGHVIEEGLATFLGTKEDSNEYLPLMQKLAKDYKRRKSYSLENILNNTTEWNGYPSAYPGGALICEVIHEVSGDEGLNQLVRGNTKTYSEIIGLTSRVLQLKEYDVIQLIEKKLKEFE